MWFPQKSGSMASWSVLTACVMVEVPQSPCVFLRLGHFFRQVTPFTWRLHFHFPSILVHPLAEYGSSDAMSLGIQQLAFGRMACLYLFIALDFCGAESMKNRRKEG